MKVSFPAQKATMGGRTYYACTMKLNAIPKMFTFNDWIEFSPEQREQRVLNYKRVPQIAKYVLENEDGYLFASITASYKCDVKFTPVPGYEEVGYLEMEFEEANFVINDGQHRCAAIAHAIKENPTIGDDSISVLLFPYENLSRVQQMFSDLNRNVAKTSKSLDILYDKRDMMANVTLEVCEKVPVFKDMVDKDAVSLPARSTKLFTLSALYDANEELLKAEVGDDEATINSLASKAHEFWTALSLVIPDWEAVKKGHLRATELRQDRISTHSVVLRALGAVGAELIKSHPEGWKDRLGALSKVDWRKTNQEWENVCIIANSVVSNRQARFATKAYLKSKVGLPLNDAEQRAVTPPVHVAAED